MQEGAVAYVIDDDQVHYDGSPASVHAYIRKLARERFPEEQRLVLENVTGLIVPGIVSEARKQGDVRRAYSLANDAMNVIRDLNFALHFALVDGKSECQPWLWWHIKVKPGPTNSRDRKYNNASEELLETAAGQYLARPWMQDDYIDWCIVDASVQMEFFAYTRHVWDWCLLFIIGLLSTRLLGIWHGGFSWVTQTAPQFAVLVVAAGGAFFVIRRWTAMYDTYTSLDGPVLSPTRVRAEIQAAKNKGVVWPRVIWPIIDTAVAGDPNVWRVSPFQRG